MVEAPRPVDSSALLFHSNTSMVAEGKAELFSGAENAWCVGAQRLLSNKNKIHTIAIEVSFEKRVGVTYYH